MISNFFDMPGFLKILTAMALCIFGFLASTMLSGGVNLYGYVLTTTEWWSSGAGYVFLIVVLLFNGSGILMLKRVAYGRAVHITALLASNIGAWMAIQLNHVQSPTFLASTYFNLAATAAIACYLYFNKGSRAYFSDVHS